MLDFTGVKAITIPEGSVKKITSNGVVLWERKGFTNLVPLSTEADGKTIYNGGKGYKDGYRVRSGGAEASNGYAVCTGYIPYKKGDKLYIYPPFYGGNADNAINFYDSGFNCLGQITDAGSCYGFCTTDFKTKIVKGESVLDISNITVSGIETVAYVRVTNCINEMPSSTGADMIITKNKVTSRIPSEYQEVEYIRNNLTSATAGSYIDLGFAFDTACTFYINYVPHSSGAAYIFGAAENSGTLRCMITDQTANTLLYGASATSHLSVGAAKYNTEKSLKCEIKKGLLKITDLLKGDSVQGTSQAEYTMTNNLFIFAQNYNGSARMANASPLKSFSYYDKTDTLICELVPCYRKSDGVIGMYDIVRKIFLTNAGSSSFTKGADV